jgi:hypothetical protein
MFNRKLKPGQKGTKKLMEKYGEKLLNVRYVYNSEKHIMMKTVELLIQQKPWYPNKNKIPYNKKVHLKIEYGEVQLGRLVKAAGGYWNKEEGYWELPYREAVSLGLDNRIMND